MASIKTHRTNKSSAISIPHKLLQEAVGHFIVVEARHKKNYRGRLKATAENSGLVLEEVYGTYPSGEIERLDTVFIKNSQILAMILPEILRESPNLDFSKRYSTDRREAQGLRNDDRNRENSYRRPRFEDRRRPRY